MANGIYVSKGLGNFMGAVIETVTVAGIDKQKIPPFW
jgi:hypothetical protein